MRLRQSLFSTYSIVARDPATGQLGVAVQTHQMCVGSRILWARPGLGAVITQSLSNISYAPMAGAMLREGIPPERIIAALVASDDRPEVRQVAVVDAQGRAAAFTGIGCIREAGHHTGEGYSVQANMMTHPTVVKAMAETYEAAQGDLAQRMLAALQAAQAEGGDIRGMQSAALKVVPADLAARDWAVDYDLRVDEHANPVSELARLVRLRHSQIADEAGYAALASGDRDRALALWQAARDEAPELEETGFWQAVALADEYDDVPAAGELLAATLADDPRRVHWLDLIERLVACGLIEHADRAAALVKAVKASAKGRKTPKKTPRKTPAKGGGKKASGSGKRKAG